MIRFTLGAIYYWFPTHVEADTGTDLVKYQLIRIENEADFTKYHCGIFENEYPFKV